MVKQSRLHRNCRHGIIFTMDQQKAKDPVQLLTWLDEQQREDRKRLAELRGLTEAQAREMSDLTQRFESLERRQTNTQAQLVKFSEIEDALQELKNEITAVLKDGEARLQKQDNQLESRLEAQDPKLASLARSLETAQNALSALEGRVEAVPARLEDQTKQAAGLARDIGELEKRFTRTQARLAQVNERLSTQTDSTTVLAQQLEQLEGRLSNTQSGLTQFGERLSHQGDSTASLAKQLEHVESRLSNTRAALTKFPQIEAALRETRDDIVLMIKDLEEEWRKEAREAAELRESEVKDLRRALDSIERRLEPIPQLDERIKALAAEDKRLRDLISEHEQRIPPLREAIQGHRERISYLEEDQPKITRRTDELERHIPRLDKAIEETASKIPFLEEWAQRSAEQIDELKRFEDQMDQWRTGFIEEIRQGEQHRDRRLTDWEKVLEEHADIIDQWRETLRRYETSHQDSRRALGEVQELAQHLERDQAEVAEQQRLADERLQRELEAWQQENEKRWRLFLKKRDYDWEQQQKIDVVQDRRLEDLEVWLAQHVDRFAEELDRLDENDRRVLARLVKLVRYLDEIVERQIARRRQQRDRLSEEMLPDDVLITRSPVERRLRATQPLDGSESKE